MGDKDNKTFRNSGRRHYSWHPEHYTALFISQPRRDTSAKGGTISVSGLFPSGINPLSDSVSVCVGKIKSAGGRNLFRHTHATAGVCMCVG